METFRKFFRDLPDGLFLAELNRDLVEANQTFLDLINYSHAEIKGLKWTEFLAGEEFNDIEEELKQIGKTDHFSDVVKTKQGKEIPVAIKLWFLKNDDGKAEGVWGLVRDISDLKKEAKELRAEITGLENYVELMEGREEKMLDLKKEVASIKQRDNH
ncbi:MAG: PAS domain-containing protein [bacterium]